LNFNKAPQNIHKPSNEHIDKPIQTDDLRLPLLLGRGEVIETPSGLACKFLVQGEFDKKCGKSLEVERNVSLNQAELAKSGIWLVVDSGLSSRHAELRGYIWPVGEDGSIQVEQVCISADIFNE
jgi:hypothetical protein